MLLSKKCLTKYFFLIINILFFVLFSHGCFSISINLLTALGPNKTKYIVFVAYNIKKSRFVDTSLNREQLKSGTINVFTPCITIRIT